METVDKLPPESESAAQDGRNSSEGLVAAPAKRDEFVVNDERSANALVRRIIDLRRYSSHAEAWAAGETKKALREEQHLLRRYGHQLEAWLRRRPAIQRGSRRSISLPAGVVGFRVTRATLVVTDETESLEWAKANLADAVQVQLRAVGEDARRLVAWCEQQGVEATIHESFSKVMVCEHCLETGDVPNGAAIEPAQEKLYVK